MKRSNALHEHVVIVTDSREQKPYRFSDHRSVGGTLVTGDYSVAGFEDRVAVERKELNDLVGCLKGSGRERFERELARSRALDYFALVVESHLADVVAGNYRSEMSPEAVLQSIVALAVRYGVPVWFAGDRETGQLVTESILRKYMRDVCVRFDQLQRLVGDEHGN